MKISGVADACSRKAKSLREPTRRQSLIENLALSIADFINGIDPKRTFSFRPAPTGLLPHAHAR